MLDNWYWYHLTTSTYGTWLYGDHRGFRTRHYREHVEGDYRHRPPPGAYEHLERQSRALLKQQPVHLRWEWRERVAILLRDRLLLLGAEVLCVAVSGAHVHIQAKTPFSKARDWLGLAKKHATFEMHAAGWEGKLWGKRCKAKPILNREHQVNVYKYILKHRLEGAWAWSALEKKQDA